MARIQNVIQQTAGWQLSDTIGERTGDLAQLLSAVNFTGSGQVGAHVGTWNAFSGSLPVDMTLEEVVLQFLGADDEADQRQILEAVNARLGIVAAAATPQPKTF